MNRLEYTTKLSKIDEQIEKLQTKRYNLTREYNREHKR